MREADVSRAVVKLQLGIDKPRRGEILERDQLAALIRLGDCSLDCFTEKRRKDQA